MEQRMNFFEKGTTAIRGLLMLGQQLSKSTIDQSLLELLYFRVSQINGCAYCLDMHSKDLRAKGESEQRLYMIAAWREASIYSARERAAFAYAEALTDVIGTGMPDDIYAEAIRQFSEEEMVDLTIAVVAINSYNRINVAFRTPAGYYQPGQHAAVAH